MEDGHGAKMSGVDGPCGRMKGGWERWKETSSRNPKVKMRIATLVRNTFHSTNLMKVI